MAWRINSLIRPASSSSLIRPPDYEGERWVDKKKPLRIAVVF
jgi:hypothetical protein